MDTLKQRLFLAFILIFSVWLSFYVISSPEPKPKSSPETDFSAERAFQHVKKLSLTPHPIGTAANDSARSYIINELFELGLSPTIQTGIGVGSSFDRGLVGYTQNIIAKIEGQKPERTILLMAHYDSKPNTYGAGDDASGVAAILESVRAIKAAKNQPKNNIWLLITDGEERGLLGAELFADEYPNLDQIDLVLNFESRGSSGPSMMFETSTNNGHLIPNFARATPHPVANSLMYTVYKLLPNDTDLSVTKRAGLNGLNFAFAEDFLHYHTMLDTPDNLSMASLQHHGSNLLGNVRYFGNTNFEQSSNSEYVYFNNLTGGLLYYPSGWSLPLALIATLLFITFLIYQFRTSKLTLGTYLIGIISFLLLVSLGVLITFFGWQSIKILHPQYEWIIQGEVYNHSWYFWGFTFLISSLFIAIYSWLQHKLSMQKVISGPLTVWIILSLVTAWFLPTASYIFTWPALMTLVGWLILDDDITDYSWKNSLILALAFAWGIFIIAPYIPLAQVMLTTRMLPVSMLLLGLLLGVSWPLIWPIVRNHSYKWSGALVVLALISLITASFNSDFSNEHKKQNSINFVQNLSTGDAYWVSRDPRMDEWTRQFLSDSYQVGPADDISIPFRGEVLYRKTETITIPNPSFSVLSDSTSGNLRFLDLQMEARQGIAMKLSWNAGAGLADIGIAGKSIFAENDLGRYLYYFDDLSKPVELNLTFETTAKPVLKFTFVDPVLPTNTIEDFQPRAAHMMPAPYSVYSSDATIWKAEVAVEDLLKTSE